MKLLEDIKELGDNIHEAIHKMIVELFREDLDEGVIDEIVSNLGLTDLLALDRAYSEGDVETVRDIIGPIPQLEYSMGRQSTSMASNRPQPGRVEKPQAKEKPAPAKDVTQTNRNYNQGAANAVTTKNVDSEDDPDAVMQEPEVEESMVGAPDYNPAAGGYNSTKFKKGDGDKLDRRGVESAIRNLADRYQAAMAGMNHEDEWDILSQAEELAAKYDIDLDMYFESRFESPEQKVIHMKEWLKRRAGIA